MSRLREEKRNLSSQVDELQLRYDDEVFNGGAWKKEKERLETKIGDLNKAYESATGAQAEQQAQIVSLHSQVRELRSVLNDAEADRTLLQKARRALQAELDTIKQDGVDSSTSGTEMQKVILQKQDLERSLEEQRDRAKMASDRMKKAEGFASECQMELGKIRVENSELDKLNVRSLFIPSRRTERIFISHRRALTSRSKSSIFESWTSRPRRYLSIPLGHRMSTRGWNRVLKSCRIN